MFLAVTRSPKSEQRCCSAAAGMWRAAAASPQGLPHAVLHLPWWAWAGEVNTHQFWLNLPKWWRSVLPAAAVQWCCCWRCYSLKWEGLCWLTERSGWCCTNIWGDTNSVLIMLIYAKKICIKSGGITRKMEPFFFFVCVLYSAFYCFFHQENEQCLKPIIQSGNNTNAYI